MAELKPFVFIKAIDDRDCEECQSCECEFCQSRAEAIEKMAKALYEHQYQKTMPLWEDEDNGYIEIYLKRAEAALNALLGE